MLRVLLHPWLHVWHLSTPLLLYGISLWDFLTNQHAGWRSHHQCGYSSSLCFTTQRLHRNSHITEPSTCICTPVTLSHLCVGERMSVCVYVSVTDCTYGSTSLCRDEGTSSYCHQRPGRPYRETEGQRRSALLSGVWGKWVFKWHTPHTLFVTTFKFWWLRARIQNTG